MIYVRKGKADDCESVYKLVRSMIREWTGIQEWLWPGSPKRLETLVFEEKRAGLAVAYFEEELCGYCFYTQSASSLNCKASITMENFYVKPEYRRRNVGTEMFRFMQELVLKEGILGLEWFSLARSKGDNDFFKALGQIPGDERLTYHWNNPAFSEEAKMY